MGAKPRGNALLMELLVVVFFFLLSATVILQIFLKAHDMSAEAGRIEASMALSQVWAERIAAADDPDATLAAAGFDLDSGVYTLETEDGLEVCVSLSPKTYRAGVLQTAQVRVLSQGTALCTLPVSRYCPHGEEGNGA